MARKKQEIALQKELNGQEEWDETMGKEGLFIIDIYQEWCGPCKSIVSLFRRLKNESGEDLLQFAVAKADTIDSLVRYRGTCKPCFLFYGSGTLVEVIRGVNPPELEKHIKRHLTNELNVLKGEPGAERVEIKDPAFKDIDEAERLAKERAADDDEEEEIEREVTVVLIKPDAKDRVEEIKQKLEERGIEILEQQERQLTEEEARDFYRHLEGQDWFEPMISYLITDVSTVLAIAKCKASEGVISEFREILGPANVEEAKEKEPESLRAIFGSESFKNAIHAADSGEKAQRELKLFFPEFRIPTYKVAKPKKQKKPEIEKTVALIRPDAFAEFKDEIVAKIHEAGFAIAMQKEVMLTREQAEEFYSEKKGSPFFEELISRMTNGPVCALALAKADAIKEWRCSLGEKDPKEAKNTNPQSLRAMYAKDDIEINLLHGSDSIDSARKEMEFFFPTEQTLVIIKPDAYENKDEIIQKIIENDFIIAAKKELVLSEEIIRELYKLHVEKEYFEELVSQMTSGKCVCLVLSRHDAVCNWRALMGETDPARATDEHPQSIRAIFGKDLIQNAVHGSSNPEHAFKSINILFGDIKFDSEGKHVPGTGDVPEEPEETKDDEDQDQREDEGFRSPNGEIIRTDAQSADHGERQEGEEAEAAPGQPPLDGEDHAKDDEAAPGGEADEEEAKTAEDEDKGTDGAHGADDAAEKGDAEETAEGAGRADEAQEADKGGEDASPDAAKPNEAGAEESPQEAAAEQATADKQDDAVAAKDDAAKDEASKDDAPIDDAPKDDAPKDDAPKDDAPKDEPPKDDAPKDDAANADAPKDDAPKDEAPKDETPKDDAPKDDAPKADAPKDDSPKDDAPKDDAPKDDAPKDDAPKDDAPKDDAPKDDAPKDDAPKDDAPKADTQGDAPKA